jgi:hypothetical protein
MTCRVPYKIDALKYDMYVVKAEMASLLEDVSTSTLNTIAPVTWSKANVK